jgi:DNA-binding CsgD family transcriptional regulator/PAS domain-containing protein
MNRMAHIFLDAATGEESWPRALGRLANSLGGFESHFMVWDRERSRVDFSAWAEFTDEATKGYCRCEHLIQSRRGQLFLTQNLPDDAFFQDEIYIDFLRPLGTRYLMGLKLADSGSRVSLLRIHRRARKGPFNDADAHKLSLLFPNFSRASQLHLNQLRIARKGELALAALGQLKIGVIVIDRGQRILYANAFAQDILFKGGSIYMQDGRLMLSCVEGETTLRCSREEACNLMGESLRRTLASDYELSVSALTNDSSPVVCPTNSDAFLVTLSRRERASQNLAAPLRNQFALTATEAFIVEEIVRGRTLQQIAAYKSISINTVKTHLKAVFVKMDVRSQSDLVRTVLMLPYSPS